MPKALISAVPGLGQAAFSARQVFHVAGGDKTDRITVIVRERNVLITVQMQGLESSKSSGRGFGPVSISQLLAGSLAGARQVAAAVAAGPTGPG